MNKEQRDITHIGQVNFRNDTRIFGIKDEDRKRHIYCLGKSGTGKSTLLLNMAIADIENGLGTCVIDPHGDVVEELLHHIPEERIHDVIYFNPADHPIAFNPLRNVHPSHRELVAAGLVSTLQKLFKDFWGPRLAHILKHSLETLIEARECTLLDIQPLLTNPDFRKEILRRITSQHLLNFWQNEYDTYSKAFRAEAIAPILNKVSLFAASVPLRNVIGQTTRGFYIDAVMNEGKILLLNLSKGTLGEDVCTLLGGMFLSAIQLAALARATIPEHERRLFTVYCDEAHSFVTLSIADILSESRKYGLSLFLTHQYINQFDPDIREAIFGNVGTLISFRVGASDGEYLAKEFYPTFNLIDLINIPRHCMYLKLCVDGTTSQPFSAYSLPPKEKAASFKHEVIAASKEKYAKPNVVFKEVYKESPKEPPNLFA